MKAQGKLSDQNRKPCMYSQAEVTKTCLLCTLMCILLAPKLRFPVKKETQKMHTELTIVFSESGDILEFPFELLSSMLSLKENLLTGGLVTDLCETCWFPTICELLFNIYSNFERNFLEVKAYLNQLFYYFKIIMHSVRNNDFKNQFSSGKKKKSLKIYSNDLISVPDFKLICINDLIPMYCWFFGLFFFLVLSWSQLWHTWKFWPIGTILMTFPFWESQDGEKKETYRIN